MPVGKCRPRQVLAAIKADWLSLSSRDHWPWLVTYLALITNEGDGGRKVLYCKIFASFISFMMVRMLYGGVTPKVPFRHHQCLPSLEGMQCTGSHSRIWVNPYFDKRKTPDILVQIWLASWNAGTFSGKFGEIAKILKRLCIDICCLQELFGMQKVLSWLGMGIWCYGVVVVVVVVVKLKME